MTLLEKFTKDNPTAPLKCSDGTPDLCPSWMGYMSPNSCVRNALGNCDCKVCWDREYVEPEKKDIETLKNEEPHILDSGDRTEFETGAVRDMREGKGRCDLLPLDVVAEYIELRKNDRDYAPIRHISKFIEEKEIGYLYTTLDFFAAQHFDYNEDPDYTMLLEVAKHFEEGAKKYGDNNWQKGIPVRCYIDSAIRHYLKYLRGDKDEPHDRAFCWNILCAIWTCKHKPELNDYAKKESEE